MGLQALINAPELLPHGSCEFQFSFSFLWELFFFFLVRWFFLACFCSIFDMNRAMDSKFSSTIKNNSDNDYNLKKKKDEELSVQISTPPISKVETLNSNDLQFDRLQPSDQELGRVKRFEFGQFVAREAVLDEEYWVCYDKLWDKEKERKKK